MSLTFFKLYTLVSYCHPGSAEDPRPVTSARFLESPGLDTRMIWHDRRSHHRAGSGPKVMAGWYMKLSSQENNTQSHQDMIKIHCLGPGSIGSLVCFHLRSKSYPINFILRKPQIQHRSSPKALSLQIEKGSLTKSINGIEYEFLQSQKQEPIESLIVTTKAHQLSNSILPLLHRISRFSTIVLLHNGLGVIEEVLERCFPHPESRPSFILANTSHGVLKLDSGYPQTNDDAQDQDDVGLQPSHGRFCHSGMGDLKLGVLPNQTVLDSLTELGNRGHWYPSSGDTRFTSVTTSMPQTLALSTESNPLMNPSLSITPTLDHHLPHLKPETHSLHHTLAALLQPELVEALGTKWLTLPDFQTSALVKLTVNATLNPITALLETRNEALSGEQSFERLAKGICHEASTVFGFQAQREKGFAIDHPLAEVNLLRHVRQVMKATGPNISSMCADVRKLASDRIPAKIKQSRLKNKQKQAFQIDGKDEENKTSEEDEHTEIDYINGYISKLGEKYGVLTPFNDTLVQLVKLKSSVILSDQRLPPMKRVHQRVMKSEEEDGEEEEIQS
ncbi:ketopantoate reductase-like protein [Melampsora americana]|nr:ketopantoate reductase-like protein [Melampsora americana]